MKVHLDTFHMIREENNMLEAIRTAGNAWPTCTPARTSAAFPARARFPGATCCGTFKEIGYDGCITIESFDPNMPKIAKLCCIWRKLADSPEQLATDGLRFVKEVYAEVYG